MIRIVVACLLAGPLLAGCVNSERPPAGAHRDDRPFGSVQLFDGAAKPLLPPPGVTVQEHAVSPARGNREFNILVISGGGSDGAFGAGVLKGWSESGKRPVFDIVTGVSTGALIANLAFLGASWDPELEHFYTRTTDKNIFESLGLSGLFGESILDTKPLRGIIARIVDERLLDAVAAAHRQGRRLFVATTDLDAGTVVVWDMGAIAGSGMPDRVSIYREILVASAAVPGLFPPVYIRADAAGEARMHVDGGVKAPILLRSFMLAGPQRRKTVYVLINGKLTLKTDAGPVAPNVFGISKRSIAELMRGLLYKTVYQGYVTTRNARAEFRMLHVPDDQPEIVDALRFDPQEMRKLFDLGHRTGRDAGQWQTEPPRIEPLERVRPSPAPRTTR